MLISSNVARWLAWLGCAAGAALLLLGAVGYALGWNATGGREAGSNIVPFCLFAGFVSILFSGLLILIYSPESLPRCPAWIPIGILALISVAVAGAYVFYAKPLILLPVDMVMGSESQFIDQIIRYRVGQPQYTPIADSNSTAYPPGAPILTYWLAKLAGRPNSIPTFRLIQQVYLLLTAFFMSLATLGFARAIFPEQRPPAWWLFFWFPFFYLIAGNPFTNVYTQVLYSDGLALLVAAVGFWLLVKHFSTDNDAWLIPMAILPGLGFLAKQKEAVWAGLFLAYLILRGKTPLRRLVLFGVAAFGSVALAVGYCRLLWGHDFMVWNFEVLQAFKVRLLEVADQVKDSGWYILPGIVGGAMLLRGERLRKLAPLWLCWLLHVLVSIYTSGMAWRPAHLGPATTIGTAWLLAALCAFWPPETFGDDPDKRRMRWLSTGIAASLLLTMILGAELFRRGRAVPEGLPRYISEIEREFDGAPREKVLLDTGSWVYLPYNVVMKDRESPMNTIWASEKYDLSATLERIRSRAYDKILARRMLDGDFLFRDDRVRKALAEYYREIRVIKSPGVPARGWLYAAQLRDVCVLVPTTAANATPPATEPSSPTAVNKRAPQMQVKE